MGNDDKLFIAAQNLVKKLNEVHENEEYQGVWTLSLVHGFSYKGPKYDKELEVLEESLKNYGKT